MTDTPDQTFRSVVKVIAVATVLGVAGLASVRAVRWVADRAEPRVDLSGPAFLEPSHLESGGQLRFAVASMVSAETTFSSYRRLIQKVSRAVGREDVFVIRPSYADIRAALDRGEVDVAIVCTGTYLHGLASGRTKLLVQPEFEKGLEYRCLVIVPARSQVRSLEDLRGKTMAFTDRESNTGYLAACMNLKEKGLKPASLFAKVIFTHSHDRSIQAVSSSVVDAAAVDSLVLESMCREDPKLRERVRVVWTSEPFGPPPVVVPISINPQLEESLRQVLLSFHQNQEGRDILGKLGVLRFVLPDPECYSSAIAMFQRYQAEEAGTWP
ncbi:MAG: phosphate/phosphite/phosphonate ABC transporter substrate-binding protein [Planctomycetes bacterium]|nr:phosphate/phosphite/phosphonate ABC transporter substrate-binding protein [Planctomycetota bacterium]